MEAPKNKGGRPRKEASEKKLHRVQIAMSDAQLADARRLAQLQDTSVSAAIAAAVPEALQRYTRSIWLDVMVQGIRDAAKRVAADTRGTGGVTAQYIMQNVPVHIVPFLQTESIYRKMRTDQIRAYDESIEDYAERIAKTHESAGLQFDNARQPYDWSKCGVAFAFLESDWSTERLYYYGEPFVSTAESPQSE